MKASTSVITMHLPPAPPSAAAATRIPAEVCRVMAHDLVRGLPDPVGTIEHDPAERRQRAAIDEVALLAPADAGELRIAIRYVTAEAWASAYLQRMSMHDQDVHTMMRLTAQAMAVGRAANASRTLLHRMQAARRQRRPEPDAAEADAQAERCAREGLLQGWAEQAERLAVPLPKVPAAVDGVADGTAWAAGGTAAYGAGGARGVAAGGGRHQETSFERVVAERRREAEAAAAAGEPEPRWMTPAWRLTLGLPEPPPPTEDERRRLQLLDDADRFAIVHPLRSRLIRRLGNLPPDCGIEPPEPELLEAIRTGNEANQRWADGLTLEQANQNAGRDRLLLWKYEEDLAQAQAPPG